MRTTIELPDELLMRAKSSAAVAGVSLKELFIEALEQRLKSSAAKRRLSPPVIGKSTDPVVRSLTREQSDEAMFG